jgi:quinol-cytochrome oxidoreductase complex cytochrome b subunit
MHNHKLIQSLYALISKYPTPSNLNYLWNFGIFAFIALMLQLVSGIILVMLYTPHVELAFISVEHIMRDVNAGSILRYGHANGASVFFIVVYAHILRGLYYGSYLFTRELLWCSGVIILLLMILTAFLGYILPWGQMSLWGATVITNLASTIPIVGDIIVLWLWAGFSVANPTLNKFFSLHYLLPFIILALVMIHILLLHNYGSSNPLGVNYIIDKTFFSPFYIIKDFFSTFGLFIVATLLICFIPNALGHPDNYIPANANVTPSHIVPEWYFLPFYAILRAIPNKALGVIALLASIIILGLLPFLHKAHVRNVGFKPATRVVALGFITATILLTYMGAEPIEAPFTRLSQGATLGYFAFFVLLPLVNAIDVGLLKMAIDPNFFRNLINKWSRKPFILGVITPMGPDNNNETRSWWQTVTHFPADHPYITGILVVVLVGAVGSVGVNLYGDVLCEYISLIGFKCLVLADGTDRCFV